MKNLNEELKNSFYVDIPEPDLNKLKQFKPLVEQNAKPKNCLMFWKRAIVSCLLLLVIGAGVLTSIYLSNPKEKEIVRYYGDGNVSVQEVDDLFLTNYFNENMSNYSFILEDCTTYKKQAIYDKETETKLLAIHVVVINNNVPFTKVEIDIILNKKYVLKNHEEYVTGANTEKLTNLTIFTKETSDDIGYKKYILLERKEYKTYLKLDRNDTQLIEKFKQN